MKIHTFTHLVVCPEYVEPGLGLRENLFPEAAETLEEIWQSYREDAERWLMEDAVESGSFPDSVVVVKLVSCLDEEAEDYAASSSTVSYCSSSSS